MKTVSAAIAFAAAAVSLTGCATESSRSLEVAKVASCNTQYHGVRTPISVEHSTTAPASKKAFSPTVKTVWAARQKPSW